MVLKALSFDSRREPKDAYDLVYVLLNASDSIANLVKEATHQDRNEPSFLHALEVLRGRFGGIDRDGPQKYGRFIADPAGAANAFAAVQDFLRLL
jgi:hypothetical protein